MEGTDFSLARCWRLGEWRLDEGVGIEDRAMRIENGGERMSIIELVDDQQFEDELKKLDERVRAYTKAPYTSTFVKAAAHHPHFLANLGDEGLLVMPTRQLPRKSKEMIAVAVSMTNGCEYCIRAHSTVLKRMFKFSDPELVELAAVTAHVNGLAGLEAAFQIRPDGSVEGPFQPLTEEDEPLLADIRQALGDVPLYYRLLARKRAFLQLIWDREQGVMRQGHIALRDKHLMALAVAATRGAHYAVRWHTAALQRLGVEEDAIFEGLMVCDLFNKNNTFTEGLLLEMGVWGQLSQTPNLKSGS